MLGCVVVKLEFWQRDSEETYPRMAKAKAGIQTKKFDDLFSETGMAWLLLFRVAFWPEPANHARKSQIDRRYFKRQNYGKFAYFRIIGAHYFIKIIRQYP